MRAHHSTLPVLARLVAAVVLLPLLALLPGGPAATAATANGLTLSVDDGQTLSGTVNLTATDTESAEPVALSIDGEPVAGTVETPPVDLVFQAHGWEANTYNTWVVNGETRIVPLTRYWDWAAGSWRIPAGALRPGVNTVELLTGSTQQALDPRPNENDDFRVRNVKLRFADGGTLTDPALGENVSVNMGDNGTPPKLRQTWTIEVPESRLRPVTTSYSWNADAAEPGTHVVTATSADGTRTVSATVTTGSVAPEPERIVLTPPADASTGQSFTWRTGSSTTDGAVSVREAGSDGAWRVVDATTNEALTSDGVSTRTHSATVTGLRPGTTYEYFVGNDDATSDAYRFTTAGNAGDPFTFLYFGDGQNELTDKWAPTVQKAYETFPEAVGSVNAGDLVDASRNESEWTELFGALGERAPTKNLLAAPGNHEYVGDTRLGKWKSNFEYPGNGPTYDGPAPDATGLTDAQRQEAAYRTRMAKAMQETVYYTDYQGVRFITLNATTNEATDLFTPANLPSCSVDCPDPKQLWVDMQAEWLDRVLADNPNKWTVATFHQPVFSTAVDRDEQRLRSAWLPVFESRNIDLVLMAHDHTYARGFVNSDATSTPGMTRGPVYAVSVSGPKYYERQPADDNVWTRNGATQVVSAGGTSTFQGITVDGNTLRYRSVVAAKWDDTSSTDVPVGGTLDSFTITKYPSGAKRVTEDGVQPPAEDPGAGPEEPQDTGLDFNIPNGARVSGITRLIATDARSQEGPSISVDDVPQEVTSGAGGAVDLQFDAHGWEGSTRNTFYINGEDYSIRPMTRYYQDGNGVYPTGTWRIPAGALRPGANTIQLRIGSASQVLDPADNANDDFRIKNVRLRFPDGATLSDPAYPASQLINMGDSNPSAARTWTWTINIPTDRLLAQSTTSWDTTKDTSGLHRVTATSADGTRSRSLTVRVDNEEPVSLNLADGAVVNGRRTITSTGDVEPVVTVDGEQIPVELRRRVVDPVFKFEGDGFQPDAAMDSIWINGELFRVLGVPEAAHGWKTVSVPIPWEKLRPGTNTIRIRAGGNLSPTGDDADSFKTRNSRLELAGDRVLRDPQYSQTQELGYGPGRKFWDFTITVPDRFETVYQADWDTSAYDDGEYAVTVARPDGRSEQTATVEVDNTGPEITIGAPADGRDYATGEFVVDASASDVNDVAELALTIDGEPVENGQTVTADDLPDGDHTLVARATDTLGNESVRRVSFRTVGNLPKVPANPLPGDGSSGRSPESTDLSVDVADPTGDALTADFKWAYRGDFAVGANTATVGQSTTAVPTSADGAPATAADRRALAAADGETLRTDGAAAYPFQTFEIAVPEDLGTQSYAVTWSGSVPDTQRAALSVWNNRTESWDLVDEGIGADLELRGRASYADTVAGGTATLMIQDIQATVIAENDDPSVWAWISDTQFYSQNDPSVYRKQMQWVLDNRESEGIGYALHTGDIQNTKTEGEWQAASSAQQMWDDAGLPYGMAPGNHDIDADGTYTTYQKYFGAERFADKPWYRESQNDNVQHADVLSSPGADYLVLFLNWQLSQDEIDWANRIIRKYPDYNVVLATHQYFGNDGAYVKPAPTIWDQIVAPNPNVDVVLSGHIGIWSNIKRVDQGRSVIEVMADYQSAPNNGDGWMRTVTFDAANQTFDNRTLSVTRAGTSWKDDAMENFTMPIELTAPERWVATDYVGIVAKSDQVIASRESVASGSTVTVPTGPLDADSRYSWYVDVTDADGFSRTSPVWTFTTGTAPGGPGGPGGPGTPPDRTAPVLTVPGDAEIGVGDAFDPMRGVTAVDEVDGDLRTKVQIEGRVDTATPGTYVLTYTVADAAGNSSTRQRTVRVTGRLQPGRPVITGRTRVGDTLTVSPGSWTPAPQLSYQWYAGGHAVDGATGTSLILTPTLLGSRVTVRVTGRREGYDPASVDAAASGRVVRGRFDTARPELVGRVRVGATLRVVTGDWSPQPAFAYRWFAGGKVLRGATGERLRLTRKLLGLRVRVVVIGTRDGYATQTRTTAPTGKVVRRTGRR
ncbi:hypothetical protein GCM10027062_36790 [Nocardioides hungaricus]